MTMNQSSFEKCDGSTSEASVELIEKCSSAISSGSISSGCFDCNICLEVPHEPVVTMCGHLYCWPCIYKWLTRRPDPREQSQKCPVCKAPLSQATVVPLYGRGDDGPAKAHSPEFKHNIPHRPPACRSNSITSQVSGSGSPRSPSSPQLRYYYSPSSPSALAINRTTCLFHPSHGGTAHSVIRWAFGWALEIVDVSPYHLVVNESNARGQQHVMQAFRSLNRISVFLSCCLILCLLLF